MSDITVERKSSALSDVIASVAQLRDHHAAVGKVDLTLLKGREFYERPEVPMLCSSVRADHPGAKNVFQLVLRQGMASESSFKKI